MSNKKQAALLLGVACLFIVIILSWNNLNRSGAQIETQSTAPKTFSVDWYQTLSNDLKTLSIPESILKEDQGQLVLGHEDTANLRRSVEFALQNNYTGLAAYLQLQLAEKSNSSLEWGNAGRFVYTYGVQMQDTLRRDFIMAEAIRCFDAQLQLDENNRQATLYKGLALADKRETMMNAVPLLLQVVREDSTNILANYTLGMLAIESGQLDKALNRFEKLISLQPSNAEYHFQAGRTCELMGDKELAIKYYSESLNLTSNQEIQEQLKQIIQHLK
ncbi:MAG: hypothetical protein LPK45_02475 [Bacteroidota bacterium]|nr:hypothetical protein [Bacteroidota bacterium]MDX5429904.1 hypothetical protein [Bacteroidota bacterium]MDX5468678.1 hypothetical protein [Bacteroidota bacterium]